MNEYGWIDILVNVVGVNCRKLMLEVMDEDYDFIMDINFCGVFLMLCEVG